MALSDYMKSILGAMTGDSNQSQHNKSGSTGANNGSDSNTPGQNNKSGNSQNSGQSQGDFTGKAGSAAGDAFNSNKGKGKGEPFDTHINGKGEYESLDGTEARDSEITDKDISDAIKDALNVGKFNKDYQSKSGGKGSFNREIADKKLRITQPWKRIMRQMVQKVQYKRSFSRVNSRMAAARVVSPSTVKYNQHSDIIFAIDVSGSMSDRTVSNIMNEVLALSRTTNIKNMRVLFWDGAVTGDVEVKNGKKLGEEKGFFNFIGGGGTNIDCVYDYIIDKKYEPSGVCYFTDGYVNGSKIYTGKRNDCENAFLITKNGSPKDMEQIKKEYHYTNMSIYQTDL